MASSFAPLTIGDLCIVIRKNGHYGTEYLYRHTTPSISMFLPLPIMSSCSGSNEGIFWCSNRRRNAGECAAFPLLVIHMPAADRP